MIIYLRDRVSILLYIYEYDARDRPWCYVLSIDYLEWVIG